MEAKPVTLYGKQYWKVGEDVYVQSGNKLLKVDRFEADGTPVVGGVWSEETPNKQGGQDCTVHVECFQIGSTQHKPNTG